MSIRKSNGKSVILPGNTVILKVDGSGNDLLLGDQLDVEIIDEKKKKKRKQGRSEEEEEGEDVNHRTPRIFKIFQ